MILIYISSLYLKTKAYTKTLSYFISTDNNYKAKTNWLKTELINFRIRKNIFILIISEGYLAGYSSLISVCRLVSPLVISPTIAPGSVLYWVNTWAFMFSSILPWDIYNALSISYIALVLFWSRIYYIASLLQIYSIIIAILTFLKRVLVFKALSVGFFIIVVASVIILFLTSSSPFLTTSINFILSNHISICKDHYQ